MNDINFCILISNNIWNECKSNEKLQSKKNSMYSACNFATTNCSGATLINGEDTVTMIESSDNQKYWKATQRFKCKRSIVYGDDPSIDPSRTIITNERFFERKLEDVRMSRNYPYTIRERKDRRIAYQLKMKDGTEIITTLKTVATKYLKCLYENNFVKKFPNTDINFVLTLPAHYRATQQRATAQAGNFCIFITCWHCY